MNNLLNKKGFISDMDGVIYHGNKILPGVKEFVNWMIDNDKKFVFLTNSPEKTPQSGCPARPRCQRIQKNEYVPSWSSSYVRVPPLFCPFANPSALYPFHIITDIMCFVKPFKIFSLSFLYLYKRRIFQKFSGAVTKRPRHYYIINLGTSPT